MSNQKEFYFFLSLFLFLLLSVSNGISQEYKQITQVKVSKNSAAMNNPWAGGLNSPQFCEVDLNNDGRKDLFVHEKDGKRQLTFIHVSNDQYVYDPIYAESFPEINSWVLIADYNCDGIDDLFTHGEMAAPKSYKGYFEEDVLKFELDKNAIYYETSSGSSLNLYTVSTHRPIFKDINGDGDRDFLSFDVGLTRIYYYENQRIERNIPCDSLYFDRVDRCWGNIKETGGITLDLILDDTCASRFTRIAGESNTVVHPGGTVLDIYDENKDGVYDLILGDATYERLNYLRNNGSVEVSNIYEQDDSFPTYNTMADMAIFPAPYMMDIDKDGDEDLLIAPFLPGANENYKNVWLYKNNGSDSNPFRLEKEEFLVGEMIDVGELAYPSFYDYNNDGLKDMVIGNGGYFEGGGDYLTSLTLYANTGSASKPEFTYVDNDYLSLSTLGLDDLVPFFGDLDGDSDLDLVCGESGGKIVTMTNNNGTFGNTRYLKDELNNEIDIGQYSAPVLFDFDNNGTLDLIIGTRNGNVFYYENVGSINNYDFSYRTDSLGKVTSRGIQAFGFSSPAIGDFDDDGLTDLLLGGFNKGIQFYSNIGTDYETSFTMQTSNFLNTLIPVEQTFSGIETKLKIATADISGDNRPEILTGLNSGGLLLYSNDAGIVDTNALSTGFQIVSNRLTIFPNPTTNKIQLQFNSVFENGKPIHILVYNIMGELVDTKITFHIDNLKMDVSEYLSGIYLINIRQDNKLGTVKLVKY